MKSRFIILFILLSIIFAACKNKAVGVSTFEITVENVLTDSNVVHISGTYSCAKDVATMKINIGLDESLSDVSVYSVQLAGKDFSVDLEGLNPGTKYYYCYSVNFGTSKDLLTDVESFTTLVGLPVVKTIKVQPDGDAGCQVTCNVTSDGGSSIIERGICWNTSGNPSIDDHAITDEHNGLGEYVCHISDLISNTTYHIRAYAKNSKGVSYGEDMPFELEIEETLPEVQTSLVTGITATTAVCGGTVTSEGSSPVTRKGICWSTSPTPTISNNHLDSGHGLGEFSVTLTGLTPNATYYVRAYAINDAGTNYGAEESFVATDGLPEVYTVEITDVTTNSAVGHGKVTNHGGSDIIELGMCWNTNHNPNISNSHAISLTVVNEGEFTVSITGLEPGVEYYARAYAKNSQGIGYGDEVPFKTDEIIQSLPTVHTLDVTDINQTSAKCGGKVTNDGGSDVTNRGVCWSTMENPVVSDNATDDGSGLGDFVSNIFGLSAGITYYVRAYATNSVGTGYGEQKTFTTDPIPEEPIGALDGLFSVSATKRVWFSCGNLQYRASTDTWRFVEDQTNYVGEANASMSSYYSGWIDLFGWGTSNYNHGAHSYRPWSTNVDPSEYYAYNNPSSHLYNGTGQADWGYNRIQNGGDQEHYGWRTLTNVEWEYLFNSRQTASGIRFVKAVVKGVKGVILLPDDWATSTYPFTNPNISGCPYTTNVINAADWNTLQTHVVFLPAGGTRTGTRIDIDGSGYYWSACQKTSATAYYLQFSDETISQNLESKRSDGRLVRLVYDKQ